MSEGRTSRFRAAAIIGVPLAAILLAVLAPASQADVTATRGAAIGLDVTLGGGGIGLDNLADASGSGPPFDYIDTDAVIGIGLPLTACPPGTFVTNIIQACVINASVEGQNNADPHLRSVTSEVSVADVIVGGTLLTPPLLTLDGVRVTCRADGETVTSEVEILGGTLNGAPLADIGLIAPDTGVNIPGVLQVTLHEVVDLQETPPSGSTVGVNRTIVNAAHINLLGIADIVIGHVECEATGPDVNLTTTTSSTTTTSTTSTTTTSTTSTTTTSTTVPGGTTTTSTTTTAPTTTTSTTSTTAPPQACNTATTSGGAGTTVNLHQLGQAGPLSFRFDYNTFSVPDEIVVRYQGAIVFQTNGPVSTGGVTTATINLPAGTSTQIEVTVIGPSGTDWNYTVFCPGPTQTTTTSTTTTPPGVTTTLAPVTTLAPGVTTTVAPTTTAAPTTTSTTSTTSTTLAPVVTVPVVQPTTTVTSTTTTTRPPTVAPAPLARTGTNLLPLVGLGLLAIALGALVRRSEQSFTPVTYSAPEATAPPQPAAFRPLEVPPAASRNRSALSPLDPATSEALSAFEADDDEAPDPGASG